MSIETVFQQMLMIFFLMMSGYFLVKKGMLSTLSSREISGIVVNICNPALLLCSAFESDTTATNHDLLVMAVIAVVSYAVLIAVGACIGAVLRVPRGDRKYYNLMTVYGNTGFIGIPLVSAVLGSSAVIYVAVFIVAFNLCMYTHGIHVLMKGTELEGKGFRWKNLINVGTVSSVLTIVIFLARIPVPAVLKNTLTYAGNATTFLSMMLLGASLARVNLPEMFQDAKLYGFLFIRLLVIPILTALVLKATVGRGTISGVTILMMAVPMGNMPLMMATRYELDTDVLAKGIILSTILSLVTITVTSLFA